MNPFDYIIVGGGSAGCVLANRLSEDKQVRVLLLEAGGRDWNPIIKAPGGLLGIMMSGAFAWKYFSAPQQHLNNRVLYTPRGKVLGGGSSINGMVYCRGSASDYDQWQHLGNAGWSFANVLPYFKRAETYFDGESTYHGGQGPIQVTRPQVKHPLAQAFVEAGQQAGFPYNDDTNGALREGFGPVDVTVGGGQRSSCAVAYLRPAMRRPNLTVVTGAHTTRILLEAQRAVGVEYLKKGYRLQARAKREVILSAGAINSPQILMLSGIGDSGHLREHGITTLHHLDGVGKNLQDHLAISVKYLATAPISMFKYFSPVKGAMAFGKYLLFKKGPLADPGMEAIAFVKSQQDLTEPDIKFTFVMALYSDNGRSLTPEHGFSAHINVARPESAGQLRLASADPLAAPVIDQNYLAVENDRRVMRRGVQIAREVFKQNAFNPYRGDELVPGKGITSDADLDTFIRDNAEADYHSVGTCKMGSDASAVVDDQLRVRGLAGLRVVDASIMPNIIGGNTNMAVVMIAEKASDMILGKLPLSAAQ